MVDRFNGQVAPADLEPEGLGAWAYQNTYPTFTDPSNSSLLVVVDVGDLKRDVWLELLENPEVQDHLRRVHAFVASHNGRESGYCREVLDFCRPSLIVVSDGPVEYASQPMVDTYACHTSGSSSTSGGAFEVRRVLTTRRDGNMFWNV